MKKRAAAFIVVILLLSSSVLLCGFADPTIRGSIAKALSGEGNPRGSQEIEYYNDRAQIDKDPNNNFNFSGDNAQGQNPYEEAIAAVEAGEVRTVQEWTFSIDPNTGKAAGELSRHANPHDGRRYDPSFLAAICVDAESRTRVTILKDEAAQPIGRRADVAHLHFLEDREYACACYDKLEDMWIHAESVHAKELTTYTSSMYMYPDGLDGDKPSVTVRNSTNAGGHVIIFDLGGGVQLKYRIECGFQPIDVEEYWPAPDVPPVPDNPEPPTPPTPEPPTPTPTPPMPTPTLKPKDPNVGPQGQHPDNPDYGGGSYTDETVTDDPHPERNSPDAYVAPDPPAPEPPNGGSASGSGSPTVDHDNGRQETYTDPDTGQQDTGTVQAGDGRDHGDFAQQVDDHPATVEPGADPAPTTNDPSPGNDECVAPE